MRRAGYCPPQAQARVNVAQLLAVLGGAITLITLLGAGLALLRNSYLKAQVEQLRGDRDDLQARVVRLQTEAKELRATVEGQAERIAALQAVVTAREAVERVSKQVAELSKQNAERHRAVMAALGQRPNQPRDYGSAHG